MLEIISHFSENGFLAAHFKSENRFTLFGKRVFSNAFLIPKTASHFSENGFLVAHF